jgi:hypothetical protein
MALCVILAGCASGPGKPSATPSTHLPRGIFEYSAAELRVTYGAPSFIRKENGDELWRYDVGACRIFFFLRKDNGTLRVNGAESIPRGQKDPIDPNCRNALDVRSKKA